jgi:hypothetical protein
VLKGQDLDNNKGDNDKEDPFQVQPGPTSSKEKELEDFKE